MSTSNTEKGTLLFDSGKNPRFRRQRVGDMLVMGFILICLSAVFFQFLFKLLGILSPLDTETPTAVVLFSVLSISFGVSAFLFASTLRFEYLRVFQNGIEVRRGFPSKARYFSFKSINRLHSHILDYEGDHTNVVALELKGVKEKTHEFLYEDQFIDLNGFLESIAGKVKIDPKPARISDMMSSMVVKDRGRLIFEEHVPGRLPSTRARGLWEVRALRIFILVAVLISCYLLSLLLFGRTSDARIVAIVILALTVLIFADSQLIARDERSAIPLRIYDKGIEMPATWFERRFLKRGFAYWDDVGAVFSLRHNIVKDGKLVRGVENEIVLVTRNGPSYSTWLKDEKEVKKALGAISFIWPKYSEERMRIERLEEEKAGFSKTFASVEPTSLTIPVLAFDSLLFAFLGIAVWLESELPIIAEIVVSIVALDLVAGYLLTRIGKARRVLIESLGDFN